MRHAQLMQPVAQVDSCTFVAQHMGCARRPPPIGPQRRMRRAPRRAERTRCLGHERRVQMVHSSRHVRRARRKGKVLRDVRERRSRRDAPRRRDQGRLTGYIAARGIAGHRRSITALTCAAPQRRGARPAHSAGGPAPRSAGPGAWFTRHAGFLVRHDMHRVPRRRERRSRRQTVDACTPRLGRDVATREKGVHGSTLRQRATHRTLHRLSRFGRRCRLRRYLMSPRRQQRNGRLRPLSRGALLS